MTSADVEGMEDERVNFIDIEEQKDFELLPNGRYRVDITDLENKEVQNGDNEGARIVKWEFTIPADAENYSNRKIWDQHTCVPKSLWKMKALLTACGVDTSTLSYSMKEQEFYHVDEEGDEVILDLNDFVGTSMDVKIGKRPKHKGPDGTEYDAQNRINAFYEVETTDEDIMP